LIKKEMKKLLYILVPIMLLLILCSVTPFIWDSVDRTFSGDYRIPYYLGEDYFLFRRMCEETAGPARIAVMGDSVIWGHYTGKEGMLSSKLNIKYGREIFINMGVDGIHPAAMNGLVRYFCGSLK